MPRLILAALAAAVLLYLARPVLTPFIIGAILAYLFSPLVGDLQARLRAPRLAAVLPLFLAALALVALAIWLLQARLSQELRALSEAGPDLVEAAYMRLLGEEAVQFLGQQVDAHLLAAWTNEKLREALGQPTEVLLLAERTLDVVFKSFLTLVTFFYLLLDGYRLGPYLLRFVPPAQRPHVQEVAIRVHRMLGQYLRGQLFLVGLMSVATFLVLEVVFRMPFALPIALATGLLEIVPLLGPLLAGGIAALVALVHGGIGTMLGVVLAYTVLRQIEDQVVMPIVVGRAVYLHPLVTIFAVLVGAASAGVLGALLAVPTAAAVKLTLDYIWEETP